MSPTAEDVLVALRRVQYPGFTRDIVAFDVVKDLVVEEGKVSFRLDVGPGNPAVLPSLQDAARAAVEAVPGVRSVELRVGPALHSPGAGIPASRPAPGSHPGLTSGILDAELIPEVRDAIAVASGKGGVGKSTVAVNLAIALARKGASVGLLDADIYGPSIPLMMGVDESPRLEANGTKIAPFERFGVRFMSLGFLVPRQEAVIWRGPMVMKAIEQLLRDVRWGALDILVVDMPPGTGDAQLTLSQKVRLSGAVIVTTPQDVALADAIKGVAMFRKVGVPVLGIVENMSAFRCPHCGTETDIFGRGGGRREAVRLDTPFLGEIPIDPAIREGGDKGRPVAAGPELSGQSAIFLEIAGRVLATLASQDQDA